MSRGEYLFSRDHLWVRPREGAAHVGLATHYVEQLDDLVFMELPMKGGRVRAGEVFAVLDTMKCAHELRSPVSGTVLKINGELADNIFLLAESPFHEGWLMEIELTRPDELDGLMERGAYIMYCNEEAGR